MSDTVTGVVARSITNRKATSTTLLVSLSQAHPAREPHQKRSSSRRLGTHLHDLSRSRAQTRKEATSSSYTATFAFCTQEDATPLFIGCDEVGRGPIAGPVVAAACAFPPSAPVIEGVNDSKSVKDEAMREALYEQILHTPGVVWSSRVVSAARIDEINILMATFEAMRQAIVDVLRRGSPTKAVALVDGIYSPWMKGPKYKDFQTPLPPKSVALEVEPVKGGDAKVYCIAAASILAKVTRDRLMHAYDREWPLYAFSEHKGYPTRKHVAAIEQHGPCAIHRRSFAPLKESAFPAASREELDCIEKIEGFSRAALVTENSIHKRKSKSLKPKKLALNYPDVRKSRDVNDTKGHEGKAHIANRTSVEERAADTLEVIHGTPNNYAIIADRDLSSLTLIQLRAKLRERGLRVSGRKAELIDRLRNG